MPIRGADLARYWGLPGTARVTALHGGMNSLTFAVSTGGARYVAKAVPAAEGAALGYGLVSATRLHRAGFATGAPLAARDGRYVVPHGGRAVALLRWVPGRPLTRDDQPTIGDTLGRVHRALRGGPAPQPFPWLEVDAPHLGRAPWLRPAVGAALDAYRRVGPLTTGPLHADPAPEAFRLDGAAGCGLIDWASAHHGPLLYDLASAVMYVGGPDRGRALVEAYRATGALSGEEIRRGLPVLLRLRWAVQADYFARRSARNDLTGIDGPDGNAAGLDDARRALTGG
jgi:homoserine kinase type II